MRPVTLLAVLVGAASVGALLVPGGRSDEPVPVDRVEGASALAVSFVRFGEPRGPVGVRQPSTDAADPVAIVPWADEATLEAGLLTAFDEAERRRLDGTREEGGRRAALDLVFASTHSARVVVPGPAGERVGAIAVDRAQPSPARAGMLAVLGRLAASHAGRFPHARVHAVFLLNCGSCDDTDDHLAIDRAVRALTGAPPGRILTTSDKVNPDHRDVTAGFATGDPFTIFDSRPDGEGTPRRVPFLHVGRGGAWHFGTGRGRALARPGP